MQGKEFVIDEFLFSFNICPHLGGAAVSATQRISVSGILTKTHAIHGHAASVEAPVEQETEAWEELVRKEEQEVAPYPLEVVLHYLRIT